MMSSVLFNPTDKSFNQRAVTSTVAKTSHRVGQLTIKIAIVIAPTMTFCSAITLWANIFVSSSVFASF